ncbi:MAG: alpha-L-glutamate ligase [Sphingomonas bacterium]|nr:alpha-L-glutamate ligase [Sphingomonas bacterium]
MTRLTAISGLAAHARIVVNRTGPNDLIHHKPYQLELARVCGLAIPETLVTSAPDKARAFVERMGTCIIKSPGSWRYRLIETRPLSLASDFDFDLVRYCPVMLQSFVDGDREFRVTIIGNTVFAAAIDLSRSDFKTDSRLGEGRSVTASELPDQTQRALLRFHAASGLEYGAYDLRCDRNGVPHFLEVNPDGQYLFIEIETGLPISHAVAARLAEGVRPTY